MRKRLIVVGFVSLVIALGFSGYMRQTYAAQITARSMVISSNEPAATGVDYDFDFSIPTTGSMDSINIQFCSNSALVEDSCVAPNGLDVSGATLASESGLSGFVKSSSSTANSLLLTHAPGNVQIAGPVHVVFSGVVNPTNAGSYYAKIFTYPTTDGSGAYTDFGALAFAIIAGFDVSAEVPPYLTFCQGVTITGFDCTTASGNRIDLGQFSSVISSAATSQMLMATNAANGYAVQVSGITMTSGNNILPGMTNTASQTGTSQFGINLRSNTNPTIGQDPSGPGTGLPTANYNHPNLFRFHNNEIIAQANDVQDYKKYTVSYVVNVSKEQAPGVYSTTLTYVCTAQF